MIEYKGICRFPHGCCCSVTAMLLTLWFGLLTTVFLLRSCTLQFITPVNPVTGEPMRGEQRGYGLYALETDYGMRPDYGMASFPCSRYTEEEYDAYVDTYFLLARLGLMASLVLVTLALVVLGTTCAWAYHPIKTLQQWTDTLLMASLVSTIVFAVSFMKSPHCTENACRMGTALVVIPSCIVYVIVALIVRYCLRPDETEVTMQALVNGSGVDDDDDEYDDDHEYGDDDGDEYDDDDDGEIYDDHEHGEYRNGRHGYKDNAATTSSGSELQLTELSTASSAARRVT